MHSTDEIKTPPFVEAGLEMGVSKKEASELSLESNVAAISFCDDPLPDAEAAMAFLRNMFPEGEVTLTAILSDEKNRPEDWGNRSGQTLTRTLTTEAQLTKWVEGASANEVNLYYTPNRLTGRHTKKPEKTDIVAARFLHCDIDPRAGEDLKEEKQRIDAEIRALPIPPTVVIFSGGGYQCLWKLEPELPIASAEECLAVENRNRWLGAKFLAADNTQNIDRVLRLPGSVNYPDARKKKKGRKAAQAYVVEELTDWRRTYRLEDIPAYELPPRPPAMPAPNLDGVLPQALDALDALEQWHVPQRTRDLIANGKGNYPSRSEAVFSVSCELVRRGVPDALVMGILLDARFAISESVCELGHKAEAYARRQVERAKEAVAEEIVCEDGALVRILDLAEAALIRHEVPMYQRGQMLVRTVTLEKSSHDEGVNRGAGVTILAEVNPKWVIEQMARSAKWYKLTAKGKLVLTDPDERYARHLLAREGNWPYRVLRAVTHTPTLRHDGSVLQTPGYDAASQLIYNPGGVSFPAIPDNPTLEEAQAALNVLRAPFAEFPFVSEASRSVILAAVLTALIRSSLRNSPMFCIDAPTAGTGKSLLTELVGLIATGNIPAMMSQGKNDEEDEKRLSTVLRCGDLVIVIDNCEGEVKGDFLCSMMTQETLQARILGKSERVLLPNNSIVLATGNNLSISGDMCRRVLMCRIDSGEERPDTRQFRFDARQLVRDTRPAIVAAGLTILRAYVVAGKPHPMPKIGSFEEWNWVREALVWLGCGDPYETSQQALEHDPRKNELLELLAAWHDCFPKQTVTLAEIGVMYDRQHAWVNGGQQPKLNPKLEHLHRLLTDMAGRPIYNARSIGKKLRGYVGRVVGGMTIHCKQDSHGAKWSVVRLADTAQGKLPLTDEKEV